MKKQETLHAGSLNRYENILNSFAESTSGNSSIFSEAAVQTRLEKNSISARDMEIVSISSGVAGPVLCSYVLWTLGQAIEMGLKRLYFIARDGEILLEIARRLLPAFWPEVSMDLRYLWGSRQAWMLPSFVVSKRDTSRYMINYYQNSSLKAILARVKLTLPDCEAVLPKYGFKVENWERKLGRMELKSVMALTMDPEIQTCIDNRAQELIDDTLGYFAQEGLLQDIPYGMMDLGWAGGLKGAFEDILSLRGKAPVPFFFFGRTGRIGQECGDDQSVLRTYHFNTMKSIGVKREDFGVNILMEMFCASHSKGLRQYEPINGRYEPAFRESNTEAPREWGLELMQKSILRFAENLASLASRLKAPTFLTPDASDALLRAFWTRPTQNEARVWGQFPFEEDPTGSSHSCLIPPIKFINFWRLLLYGRGFKEYSEWNRGVIAAHSPLVAFFWLLCMSGYKTRKVIQHVVLRRKI